MARFADPGQLVNALALAWSIIKPIARVVGPSPRPPPPQATIPNATPIPSSGPTACRIRFDSSVARRGHLRQNSKRGLDFRPHPRRQLRYLALRERPGGGGALLAPRPQPPHHQRRLVAGAFDLAGADQDRGVVRRDAHLVN